MKRIIISIISVTMLLLCSGCGKAEAETAELKNRPVIEEVSDSSVLKDEISETEIPDSISEENGSSAAVEAVPNLDPGPKLTHGGAVYSSFKSYDSTGKLLSEGSCEYFRPGKKLTETAISSEPGITVKYSYDSSERLTRKTTFSNSTVAEQTDYKYDSEGNLIGYVTSSSSGEVIESAEYITETGSDSGTETVKLLLNGSLIEETKLSAQGVPLEIEKFLADGTQFSVTTYKETDDGYKMTEKFEGTGRKIVTRCDIDGNPLKIMEYDEDGAPSGWTEFVYRYADGTETSGGNM